MYCASELALSQSVVERTTNTHLDRRRLDTGLCYVAPLLEHSIIAVPVNTAHVLYPGISQNTSGYAPRLSSFFFLLVTREEVERHRMAMAASMGRARNKVNKAYAMH